MSEINVNCQKKRIEWIDIAKLLGIYIVLVAHNSIDMKWLNIFISFTSQAFFFLAAVTTTNKSIKIDIQKSVRTILVPYCCFFIFGYLFWWLPVEFLRNPQVWDRSIKELLLKPFVGLLLGNPSYTSFSTMVNWPLWFLLTLFWLKVIDSLVSAIKNEKLIIAINILFVILSIYITQNGNLGVITFVKRSVFYTAIQIYPAFILGKLFKKYLLPKMKDESLSFKKIVIIFVELIVSVAILLLKVFIDGKMGCHNGVYLEGVSWPLAWMGTISGIWAVISLSRIIHHVPSFIAFLAKNTICIFGFHSIINGYLLVLVDKLFKTNFKEYMPLYVSLIYAIVLMLLCMIPCVLVLKFAPWMLSGSKTNKRITNGK
ncbi:MAG: hypothetical protein GX677_05020 [Treponema sp.]|jgi:acyltransferase|nr:hypothetical protein [Treponema sp.]